MATVWLKARSATIVINSITYDITDAEYSEQYNKFEATPITGGANSAGVLAEQFGVDTVATQFKCSFVVDAANIKTLKGGRQFTVSYTGADGDAHSGTWTCLHRTKTIATKGAYKVSCDGEFSDVVSGQ